MRGRCLGAIVDQLVLGGFLADLGRFFINSGNIGPKRKCEENHAEFHDFGAKRSQNQPKWCPGALRIRSWKHVGSRSKEFEHRVDFFSAFWCHLGDFGRFWGRLKIRRGAKNVSASIGNLESIFEILKF